MPDPSWALIREGDTLVLHAGADSMFAIDDVDDATAASLAEAWRQPALVIDELRPRRARDIAVEMITAGLLRPEFDIVQPCGVEVRFAGVTPPNLATELARAIGDSTRLRLSEPGTADVLLIVRTTARLVDLYPDHTVPPHPHLLVDCAFEHTVSVGPLVFLGDTACLGCLAGRINYYWGDQSPPREPGVLAHPGLIAAICGLELERFANEDFTLANTTVAHDLQRRSVFTGRIYRLPWCPCCGADAGDGRLDLPWEDRA